MWRGRPSCAVYWIPRENSEKIKRRTFLSAALDLRTLTATAGGQWLRQRAGQSAVQSASWQKDTEAPAGTFSMSLHPSDDYGEMIKPGDVLLPHMGYEYGKDRNVMISPIIVDSCNEARSLQGATTVVRTHVHGRDWGKILQTTKTVFDPAFGQVGNAFYNAALLTQMRKSFSGSPSEMVLRAFDTFYNSQAQRSQMVGEQWQFPGSTVPMMALLNLDRFVQAPMFGYSVPRPLLISEAGNVWNLMQSLRNSAVNEMFIDVRESSEYGAADAVRHGEKIAGSFLSPSDVADQRSTRSTIAANFALPSGAHTEYGTKFDLNASLILALVLRQYPYDTDTFNLLPIVPLHESEVFDDNTSTADHEVYNFFRVRTPNLPPQAQELMFGIRVNPASVRAYGIRAFDAETTYPFASSTFALNYANGRSPTLQPFTPAVFDYYVGLLSTWYAYNERMRAGSITCRYRPDIRVGKRLRYGRTAFGGGTQIIDYYVQGVQHSFSDQPGGSRSHLTLVRGVVQDEPSTRPEAHLYWTGKGSRLPQNPYLILRDAALGGVG